MNPVFIMIGGFLGAGKTTTIARLARGYRAAGRSVGIITNDQTTDLVDTHNLRSQGFDVGEVTGSCFCCNFDALTSTVEDLGRAAVPDVILAEPVGSCTDLMATVIRPLAQRYGRPLDIAPYGVILKPSHGLRILRRAAQGGFSPQAAYIFRKQLEEADLILINRIDELSGEEIDELSELLAAEFPGRPTLRISARTGAGFAALVERLKGRGPSGGREVDVDYDIYAAGEAALGWLNGQVVIASPQPFALDALLLDLIGRLREQFMRVGIEAAHVKAIARCDRHYAVGNLVSNATKPELSVTSEAHARRAHVVINARVGAAPEDLAALVRSELAGACEAINATHEFVTLNSFRPGRPLPTHRITGRDH